MITAQIEGFCDRLEELKPLLPGHWEELALDKAAVPLDPQYEIYFRREALGELLFVTLRQNGAMIGYFIGFIAPGLHYKTCLTLTMDIFNIREDCRGGIGALKLFRMVLKEAKRRGVRRVFLGRKMHSKINPDRLFRALGFAPVEVYYSKWLGD